MTNAITRVPAAVQTPTTDVAANVLDFKRLVTSTQHRSRFFSAAACLRNTKPLGNRTKRNLTKLKAFFRGL